MRAIDALHMACIEFAAAIQATPRATLTPSALASAQDALDQLEQGL